MKELREFWNIFGILQALNTHNKRGKINDELYAVKTKQNLEKYLRNTGEYQWKIGQYKESEFNMNEYRKFWNNLKIVKFNRRISKKYAR